ncbi:CIC11C00000002551 [Sungouiella intermedia]|uniref:DNA replication complex GINS protein PSF3 n=1 Tax=Sungouiella intermedia TaxID=45354 RepID=A0A1L0BC53_9ASCO|nr:CIC11C00000002551 [[Candida] intermedia]
MGYYDIDEVLAAGERVPCKFNLTVPGLGFLEGNPGKPIEEGAKVDIPMWLAETLARVEIGNTGKRFVLFLEPDFTSPKVINAIKADPLSVDLHSIVSNFYKLSEKWASMFADVQLAEMLMTMLKERALEIDNYASNTSKHVNSNFLYSLDEFEKNLYKVTYESKKQMREWSNSV